MSDPYYGWECPRCNCVHAPWISSCNCRTGKVPVPQPQEQNYIQQSTAQQGAYNARLKGFGQQ